MVFIVRDNLNYGEENFKKPDNNVAVCIYKDSLRFFEARIAP
jgi:hypothetical protein